MKTIGSIGIFLLSLYFLSSATASAQPLNLLNDVFADEYRNDWEAIGDATIEEVDGDPCFVLRYGGSFAQDVVLHVNEGSRIALLVGIVSSERTNPHGTITDLPYLYGYMMSRSRVEDARSPFIYTYLQFPFGMNRYFSQNTNEWVLIWGIAPVPEETDTIRFFLRQAKQQGHEHDGSATRFDDLGLYLFSSVEEASAFVDEHFYP